MERVATQVKDQVNEQFGPNAVTTFVQPHTFTTWFNGDHPFKVSVAGNSATVKVRNARTDQYDDMRKYEFSEFFVGTSPSMNMTRFSGGIGPHFDGNTVLFRAKDGQWVFVAWELMEFVWPQRIVMFLSPMGNNDVPYPWARDEQGNIILFNGDSEKHELPVMLNRPPTFNLDLLMDNKVDLVEWAANETKREWAKRYQQDTKGDAYPDPYSVFWFVMGCQGKKFKKDSLCAKYTQRLPVRVYHNTSRGRIQR